MSKLMELVRSQEAGAGGTGQSRLQALVDQQAASPGLPESPTSGVTVAPKGQAAYEGEPEKMSIAEDMARSGAAGLAEGVIGIQGAMGDLEPYLRKGGMWLADQAGFGPGRTVLDRLGLVDSSNVTAEDVANMPSLLPTSEGITEAVEGVAGEFHEPQTTAGEYARTAGQFAPTLAGGSGGVLRRGLQYAIPAIASETGGQIGRQHSPEAEMAMRVGGAFLGPGGQKSIPQSKLPNTAKLRAESKLNYMRADQSGLKATGDSFGRMAVPLFQKLADEGLDRALHPKTHRVAERFMEVADKPKSVRELDTLRKLAGDAASSPDPAERRLARIVIGRLDEYLDDLGPGDIISGNAKEASKAMKEARKGWATMRKAETIEEMMETAGLTAGQFSVSGKENAIRTQFRALSKKIIKDKREAGKWTPEEKKLIKQLGNMGSGVNMLRTIGKLSPRGVFGQLGLAGAAGGSYAASDPAYLGGSVGLGLLAEGARAGALGLTRRKVNNLNSLVRSGSNALAPQSSVPLNALRAESSTLPYRQ